MSTRANAGTGPASFEPTSAPNNRTSTSPLSSIRMQPSSPPRFSSQELEVGAIYTRNQLINQFAITDSNVNNGVFRLRNSNSIWLFVTEQKPSGVTQYLDTLVGDELRWQGQTMGRTDNLVIHHERDALEIMVFYRHTKTQYPGYGFCYEGTFVYQSHTGGGPASFVLRRFGIASSVLAAQIHVDETENIDAFDPNEAAANAEDRIMANVARRRGQAKFRGNLLDAYGGRCAVTGCQVRPVLEAAHIMPYAGKRTNHVQNGLLLRADIHTLFDLKLLSINADTFAIEIAPQLSSSEYGDLVGKTLALPTVASKHPSTAALRIHRDSCGF